VVSEPGMQALCLRSLYMCPETWIEKLRQILLWSINNASRCKWRGFVKQQKTVTTHKLLQLNRRKQQLH